MSSTKKFDIFFETLGLVAKQNNQQQKHYFSLGADNSATYFEVYEKTDYAYLLDYAKFSDYFEHLWGQKDKELLKLLPQLDGLIERENAASQSQEVSDLVYAMF